MKNKNIAFVADCMIKAGAAKEGEAQKLPTFEMLAYNGGKMAVDYWGDVVVDLSGMEVSDSTTILYGHNDYSLDTVMGQTSKIEKGDTLKASGAIMGDSDTVSRVLKLSKNGFKFQASIGTQVKEYKEIEKGESVDVNGQTVDGPFTLATKSKLREISIVPLGADSTTETQIAAKQGGQPTTQENTMDKPENTQVSTPTADQIRAEAVQEQNRIMQVQNAAKDYPEISAQAVKDGWDNDKTVSAVKDKKIAELEAKIAADKIGSERPGAPNIKAGKKLETSLDVIEASAAMSAGMNVEKRYDSETLNKASDMKIRSFTELVQASLAMSGQRLEVSKNDTRDFLKAAFSTRNIANVLSNLANKFILQGYEEVEQTWREIAYIRSVNDFKVNTGNRLVIADILRALSPGGEISHGSLSDETRTVQADTKGLMYGLTRKDMINDDLGILNDILPELGMVAARTLCEDFWTEFETDTNTRFTTTGPIINRQTGGALDVARLGTAQALFRKMRGPNGKPVAVKPSRLLVGATNEVRADELFISVGLKGDTDGPSTNVFGNKYRPAVSSYIQDAPWYLVARAGSFAPMEVAFLNGRQQPFIDSSEADFNTLGIQMRIYYDYGVTFAERRAIVRSNA